MLTLHLDIISEESAALLGDRVGTARRAVRSVLLQKAYYQYSYDSFPKLSYDDITINLVEK